MKLLRKKGIDVGFSDLEDIGKTNIENIKKMLNSENYKLLQNSLFIINWKSLKDLEEISIEKIKKALSSKKWKKLTNVWRKGIYTYFVDLKKIIED